MIVVQQSVVPSGVGVQNTLGVSLASRQLHSESAAAP